MLEKGSWGLPPEDPSEVAPSNGPNKFLLQNRVDFVFIIDLRAKNEKLITLNI